MKKVFGYIRVSTVKQGTTGVSLPEQKSAIEHYASSNNLQIIRWFEEQETAAKCGRPQFTQMLMLLRRGRASGVVIHKIDRSARNLKDWAEIGDLIDQGIDVHFAHETLDMHQRGGRLAADIQAVIAADYIRNLRDEVKKGLYGRLKQGLYPFKAPVGYLNTGRGNLKAVDPIKGSLVREAFELYATGQYSLYELVMILAEKGLAQPNGAPLSRNGISLLLKNSFYYGLIRIKKNGQQFAGAHEALISRQLFEEVQEQLADRGNKKTKRHTYLFQRRLQCIGCDRHLYGEKQKRHVYYRCHSDTCKGVSLREDRIETQWKRVATHLTLDDKAMRYLEVCAKSIAEKSTQEFVQKKRQYALQKAKIEQQLSHLLELYLDQRVDGTSYRTQQEALLTRKMELERLNVGESTTQSHIATTALEVIRDGQRKVKQSMKGSQNQKQAVLKQLCSNFLVDRKKVSVELKKPFFSVGGALSAPVCEHWGASYRICTDKLANEAEKVPRSEKKISERALKQLLRDVMEHVVKNNIQSPIQSP